MTLQCQHDAFIKTLTDDGAEQVINEWWNSNIRYVRDNPLTAYVKSWQTPGETLSKGTGDCEDIAIGKFYDLLGYGRDPYLNYCRVGGAYHMNVISSGTTLDNQHRKAIDVFYFNEKGAYIGDTLLPTPVDALLPPFYNMKERRKAGK